MKQNSIKEQSLNPQPNVRATPQPAAADQLDERVFAALHAAGEKKAKEAYSLMAEEDQKGISPGSAKIAELFNTYGPALVLIDEWVAYARQLYHKDGLPGGSFESNITFVQTLTEATKNAPHALVVAALPASKVEVGGEGGELALASISDVFSRLKAVWKPATSTESFEIVRRRLFQPLL